MIFKYSLEEKKTGIRSFSNHLARDAAIVKQVDQKRTEFFLKGVRPEIITGYFINRR
jgi:hypothetical protein